MKKILDEILQNDPFFNLEKLFCKQILSRNFHFIREWRKLPKVQIGSEFINEINYKSSLIDEINSEIENIKRNSFETIFYLTKEEIYCLIEQYKIYREENRISSADELYKFFFRTCSPMLFLKNYSKSDFLCWEGFFNFFDEGIYDNEAKAIKQSDLEIYLPNFIDFSKEYLIESDYVQLELFKEVALNQTREDFTNEAEIAFLELLFNNPDKKERFDRIFNESALFFIQKYEELGVFFENLSSNFYKEYKKDLDEFVLKHKPIFTLHPDFKIASLKNGKFKQSILPRNQIAILFDVLCEKRVFLDFDKQTKAFFASLFTSESEQKLREDFIDENAIKGLVSSNSDVASYDYDEVITLIEEIKVILLERKSKIKEK